MSEEKISSYDVDMYKVCVQARQQHTESNVVIKLANDMEVDTTVTVFMESGRRREVIKC